MVVIPAITTLLRPTSKFESFFKMGNNWCDTVLILQPIGLDLERLRSNE